MKRSKYGNVKTHGFDSKAEYHRWMELQILERAGEITNLRRQVRVPLNVNSFHVCDYIADFVYTQGGALVIEDVKGVRTAVYRLKKKLMLAAKGIQIREINAKDLGIRRKP